MVIGYVKQLFSGFVCVGFDVKCSPILSMMSDRSFPRLFMVLISTSSIVFFFAVVKPDWLFGWIVLKIKILLFLKHLNPLSDFAASFFEMC